MSHCEVKCGDMIRLFLSLDYQVVSMKISLIDFILSLKLSKLRAAVPLKSTEGTRSNCMNRPVQCALLFNMHTL